MRILFTVIPEKGHLNPYIPVAQTLQAAGHVVAFYSAADITEQLYAAGLNIFLGDADKAEPPAVSRGRVFAENIKDPMWLRSWIKSLLIDAVPAGVEPLRTLVKEFSPDIIVTDPMLYQTVIVAEQEGIKWAAVSNSLNPVIPDELGSELLRTVEWLSPARSKLFASHGVREIGFRGCDSLSPYLTTCFSTQEFIGRPVSGVHMTGPSLPLYKRGDETVFSWELLDHTKKKIFMSFGSQIYYQPDLFKRVIQTVRSLRDVQLVLSVSELAETDELGTLPNDIILARYVPQIELLKHVDLFITHGGASSVMESLASGVPLLISPLCNDQFHQSWFIKKAGVGNEIDLNYAKSEKIRDAIMNTMNDPDIRKNVARVHESYRQDGAAATAKLIEEVAA